MQIINNTKAVTNIFTREQRVMEFGCLVALSLPRFFVQQLHHPVGHVGFVQHRLSQRRSDGLPGDGGYCQAMPARQCVNG